MGDVDLGKLIGNCVEKKCQMKRRKLGEFMDAKSDMGGNGMRKDDMRYEFFISHTGE